VNSYGEGDIGGYGDHSSRESVLYRNNHGLFTKVYRHRRPGRGASPATSNGDGRTDGIYPRPERPALLNNG
jgi:hypothetical protein